LKWEKKKKKKKEHTQRRVGKACKHEQTETLHIICFFPNLYTIELSEAILILSPIKSSLQNFLRVSWLGWNVLDLLAAQEPTNQPIFCSFSRRKQNITHADAAQSVARLFFSSPEI